MITERKLSIDDFKMDYYPIINDLRAIQNSHLQEEVFKKSVYDYVVNTYPEMDLFFVERWVEFELEIQRTLGIPLDCTKHFVIGTKYENGLGLPRILTPIYSEELLKEDII